MLHFLVNLRDALPEQKTLAIAECQRLLRDALRNRESGLLVSDRRQQLDLIVTLSRIANGTGTSASEGAS
jgi:hypothetical protein